MRAINIHSDNKCTYVNCHNLTAAEGHDNNAGELKIRVQIRRKTGMKRQILWLLFSLRLHMREFGSTIVRISSMQLDLSMTFS